MTRSILLISIALLFFGQLEAQDFDQLSKKYGDMSWDLFKDMLAIDNDANYPDHIQTNLDWCKNAFPERGFSIKVLDAEAVPLLLAEKKCENAEAPTVLIYLQIDGQPVDPEFWYQEDPYEATLKAESPDGGWEAIDWEKIYDHPNPDWRIFARSTSDAKGPVAMFLTAMDAIIQENLSIPFHMKVIMDFEEELGSPHLPDAVKVYKDDLAADCLIIFDGPMHDVNEPTLTFGARGISTITVTVYGPVFPQHSGHYGNFIPNPALRLAQLLTSMKDDRGVVTIPGFYDGIDITDETKQVLSTVPDDINALKVRVGMNTPDGVADTYQESIQYPSLNIRGMASGWVGSEKRTIIPSQAVAEIDVRTVLESDPERLLSLIKDHVAKEGFYVIDRKPTHRERLSHDKICRFNASTSYLAFRTDPNSDVGLWLSGSIEKAFGQEPIKIRTSGGSIPISPFVNTLGIPAVTVPTVNRDNNQHSPNENIRIGNYYDGIKTMLAILTEPLLSGK